MKYLIVFLTFVLVAPAMAEWLQPTFPPCLPDCEQDTFDPPYPDPPNQFTVRLNCGEDVIVYYRTRIACGIFQDVFIEYIEFAGPQPYWKGFACGQTMTLREMMNNATEQLLIANPMNFEPNEPDECEQIWRVLKASCWETNFPTNNTSGLVNPGEKNNIGLNNNHKINSKSNKVQDPQVPSHGIFKPCDTQFCCLEAYDICIDATGNKTITFNSELSQSPTCPARYENFCEPVCGSIYNR